MSGRGQDADQRTSSTTTRPSESGDGGSLGSRGTAPMNTSTSSYGADPTPHLNSGSVSSHLRSSSSHVSSAVDESKSSSSSGAPSPTSPIVPAIDTGSPTLPGASSSSSSSSSLSPSLTTPVGGPGSDGRSVDMSPSSGMLRNTIGKMYSYFKTESSNSNVVRLGWKTTHSIVNMTPTVVKNRVRALFIGTSCCL